jgi:hypothetical protein
VAEHSPLKGSDPFLISAIRAYEAFGVALESALELPGLAEGTGREPALRISLVAEAPAPQPGVLLWETAIDGLPYRMWQRPDGYLMVHEDSCDYFLNAALDELVCSPRDPASPGWRRFLLDTVLWSTSFLRGFELLHASAVAGPNGILAIASGTGGGKTSLVLELMRRGLALFSDDIVALSRGDDGVAAHAGPALMNVPAAVEGHPGRELARFGGERWVEVTEADTGPLRVNAICLLERSPGAELALERAETTALDLLRHSVGFEALRARRRARFELFAELATTPVWRLTADLDEDTDGIADLLEPLTAAAPAVVA